MISFKREKQYCTWAEAIEKEKYKNSLNNPIHIGASILDFQLYYN